MFSKPKCYRCGRTGHLPTHCRYKTVRCHKCQKVGHLASVCNVRKPSDHHDKITTGSQRIGSLQEVDNSNSDDSGSENTDYLHNLLQLGTLISKFLLTVDINSVPIEMEIDSGAECSAIPLSVFEQQLADVCELQQSSVSLF